jgi:hypothetical protein
VWSFLSTANELSIVIITYCKALNSRVLVTQMYTTTFKKLPCVKEDVVLRTNNAFRMLLNLHIHTLFIYLQKAFCTSGVIYYETHSYPLWNDVLYIKSVNYFKLEKCGPACKINANITVLHINMDKFELT